MPKQKRILNRFNNARTILAALMLAVLMGGATIVHADQFSHQIDVLNSDTASRSNKVDSLQAQAGSYQDAINKLQQQIGALEDALQASMAQQAKLQQEIIADKHQIQVQKGYLSEDIRTMYVDGQLSTIEELATSKNLSDYVDKEEYRTAVQNKVDSTIQEITALEKQLQAKKEQVDHLIAMQKQKQAKLASDRQQQAQLLGYNESQQNTFNATISANRQQIAKLREAQAAANRRLDSSGQVVTSGSCGGSYPAAASGRFGSWGCNYEHTSDFVPGCNYSDSWGMCNRECVSYTAWMVYKTYGVDTTGFGNANQWPGSASSAGIATGYTPKVGSVAIYSGGSFGHAMWVVGVSGNQVHVYSYNDGYDGNFYDHWVSSSGLTYIYFGG